MMDIKTHQIDDSEKFFQKVKVNLSKMRKLRYNDVNELTRMERILLIMIENKKKILHELSEGDEELEIMVKELEKLSKDPDIVSYYNEKKLEEMARRMDMEAEVNEAVKEAVDEAREEARKKTIETAKKMLEKNMNIMRMDEKDQYQA